MSKKVFIAEADAITEDLKERANFWMCRPEICPTEDIQICRAVIPPGEGHNFHTHPELEESIYVLEGEIEQWVLRERQTLKSGELADIPKGVVHATFNCSDKDALILASACHPSIYGFQTSSSVRPLQTSSRCLNTTRSF